jgi:undecaprenyl-diphosphatase
MNSTTPRESVEAAGVDTEALDTESLDTEALDTESAPDVEPVDPDKVAAETEAVDSAADEAEARKLLEALPEEAEVTYERSPIALFRLIISIVSIALVGLLGELLPHAQDGLELDLRQHAGSWTIRMGDLFESVAAAFAITVALLFIGVLIRRRLWRQVLTSAIAMGLGVGIVLVAARVGGMTPGRITPEELLLAGIAGGLAVSTSAFGILRGPLVAWLARAAAVFAVLGSLGSLVSISARIMVVLVGLGAGSLVALALGSATRRLTRRELAAALEMNNLPISTLAPFDADARGSQPWTGELRTGRPIFVKVEAMDQLRANQLFRFWRRLMLRDTGDEAAARSLRRSTEHEAFVAYRAMHVGVRTPSIITTGTIANPDCSFTVFNVVDGTTLADLEEVPEALLRSAWEQINILQRARIAHRDLRAANIMACDKDAWLIDFGFSEAGVSDELLQRDVAEFLASSTVEVGSERAVAAAVSVLGPDRLANALPWIQPLALSKATRSALSKKDFEELRQRSADAARTSLPELPELRRVSLKAVLSILALGLAIYTVLPQITKGMKWNEILTASPGWATAAVAFSFVTYIGAALALMGSVPQRPPLLNTFLAQVASSFTSRITPGKVGGMALNVRYLTKQQIDTGTATTGVAVSTAAGTIVHVLLMVVTVLWAGNIGLPGLKMPQTSTLILAFAVIGGLALLSWLIPPVREWMTKSAWPSLRRGLRSLGEVMRTPSSVALLFGGSAMVTIANIAALAVSLWAFGSRPELSAIALVYLAGSAIASAAPTPGGLGATEAALVAGLAAVKVDEAVAVPAVLLFRGATFWLPILPGWLFFTILQKRGEL